MRLALAFALTGLLLAAGQGIAPGAGDAQALADATRAQVEGFKDGLVADVAPYGGDLGATLITAADGLEEQARVGAGVFLGIAQALSDASFEAIAVERHQAELCLGLQPDGQGDYDPGALGPDLQCLQHL